MNRNKIIASVFITIAVALYFFIGKEYLTLNFIQSYYHILGDLVSKYPIYSHIIFFALYLFVSSTSIPGALILTLLGGALFNVFNALLLISFSSTLGATLSFLISRTLLRDVIIKKFNRQYKIISNEFNKNGSLYLLSLRLVPIFPFFIINLIMGLTDISIKKFYILSQIAMLPATIIYIHAGNSLMQISTPSDILSPKITISFIVLGLFPLTAKAIINSVTKMFGTPNNI